MRKLNQLWQTASLPAKLSILLLPSTVAGIIIIMEILNLEFNATFLNKHHDLTGWGAFMLSSGITFYIAVSIFLYSFYGEQTRKNSEAKRKNFVMNMIGKNLIGQASLLAGIQRRAGKYKTAVSIASGKKIDIDEFDEKGLQLNNSELKNLLNISFDVIESELMEKLIKITEQFEFRERFKEEREGDDEWFFLVLIKDILQLYFPDLLSEFNKHVTAGRKTPV